MIIPVILETDFEEIKRKVSLVENTVTLVQIDFVDGKLTNGLTFLDIYKLDELKTPIKFDIHLLVENPLKFLDKKVTNAIKICSQIEAWDYVDDFIDKAKELGYKTGLSLNVPTKIDTVEPYLDRIDFVQFMDVRPGGQGNEFQISVLEKIEEFRALHSNFPIQVDGGIDKYYLPLVLKAGANDVVIGSDIFKSANPEQEIKELMRIERLYD